MEFNLHNLSLFLLIPASGVSFASRTREGEKKGPRTGGRKTRNQVFFEGRRGVSVF